MSRSWVRSSTAYAVAFLLAIVGQSCGGGTPARPPTAPTAPTVASVIVSGWLQPLKVGETVQLTATAIYSDGTSKNVTAEASWESSNGAIASVQGGLISAKAEGAVAIIARFGGRDGNQGITVERVNSLPEPPPKGLACGVERWSVKTLSDVNAGRVDFANVQVTTIKALNELPTHCSGLPDPRSFPQEFVVYEVVGRITFVRLEDDRDYHIAVADPADSSYTIVTEVADTACEGAISSPYRDTLASARTAFASLLAGRSPSSLVGTTVRLRGVGFFDFNHGQNGRSRNCMELHPVTMINGL